MPRKHDPSGGDSSTLPRNETHENQAASVRLAMEPASERDRFVYHCFMDDLREIKRISKKAYISGDDDQSAREAAYRCIGYCYLQAKSRGSLSVNGIETFLNDLIDGQPSAREVVASSKAVVHLIVSQSRCPLGKGDFKRIWKLINPREGDGVLENWLKKTVDGWNYMGIDRIYPDLT